MLNHFFYSDYNIFYLEALFEMLATNKVLTACRRTNFFVFVPQFSLSELSVKQLTVLPDYIS